MKETLRLTVMSPEAVLLTEDVSLVVIPGQEGDFGVLPRHIALVTTLRAGLLQTYKESHVAHQLFVSAGFVNVNEQGCTVLAQEGVFVKDLKADVLTNQLSEALESVHKASTESERSRALYLSQIIQAKLEILKQVTSL